MSTTDIQTAPALTLTAAQTATVACARKALAQDSGTDVMSLVQRVGQPEWWVSDLLAVVGQLRACK